MLVICEFISSGRLVGFILSTIWFSSYKTFCQLCFFFGKWFLLEFSKMCVCCWERKFWNE